VRNHDPWEAGYPVAITGIGMANPLGITFQSCWENLLSGKSGISRITKFDPKDNLTQIGGQLPESYWDWEKNHIPKRMAKQTVQTTRIFLLCASTAIQGSGLDLKRLNLKRCAVIAGTTGSSVRSPVDHVSGADKFKIIREMYNAIPARISLDYGFQGPSYTVSSSSGSGMSAVSRAYDAIRWGKADMAVTGGVDTLLTRNYLLRVSSLGLLTQENDIPEKAIKPFDLNRSGFTLSDGGCALVLESAAHALQRKAKVHAWITGYCNLTDPGQIEPAQNKMAETLSLAMKNSKIQSEKIGLICAYGVATSAGDRNETQAIKSVFGENVRKLRVSASKSMLGHLMGASGVTDIAVGSLALQTQKISPTINYSMSDPECDLNCVPNEMIEADCLDAVIIQDFGFGGHHYAMVLEKSLRN
jgi:3-oxoacyl-[acyl-carrier-protein] synthase II